MPRWRAFLVLTSSLTHYPAWNKLKVLSLLFLSKRRHKNMIPASIFTLLSCRERDKAILKLYFIVLIRHIKKRIKRNCKNSKQVSQKPSNITTVTDLCMASVQSESCILASILHKTRVLACAHKFRMRYLQMQQASMSPECCLMGKFSHFLEVLFPFVTLRSFLVLQAIQVHVLPLNVFMQV